MSTIREFFNESGYYHAKGIFSPTELKKLETDFDAIIEQMSQGKEDMNARWEGGAIDRIASAPTVVFHTHNVQKFSAAWLQAFLHPKFLEVCTELLGPDVILHHSKLFQKPAEKGAPFPMHQDWTYFPTVKDTMLAGVIHVSDATDEMGCLRVVPGSHKLGRIQKSDGQSDVRFSERFPIEDALPVQAKAGDVVFFHYCTAHGSMPNRSSIVRKTVLAQLHAGDDSVEEGNRHPNERLALAGMNRCVTRVVAGQA